MPLAQQRAGSQRRQGIHRLVVLISRRVFAFEDTEPLHVHWRQTRRVKPNLHTLRYYCRMKRIGSAMRRIRWTFVRALSIQRTRQRERLCSCAPFLSRIGTLCCAYHGCSLRLRISAVSHMMLSYCSRRRQAVCSSCLKQVLLADRSGF